MSTNKVLEKIRNREPSYGVWLGMPNIHSARLLATLPLDWMLIDAEHSPMDESTLAGMVAGISAAQGPLPFVRIAQANAQNIKRALDAGASGVIAPMINTAEEAKQVVSWAKFPPIGTRSFGSMYAGLAFDQTMAENLQASNQQTAAGVQIESKVAIENLDGILSTPGLDMAYVGPVDLSISLGIDPFADEQATELEEALSEIVRVADMHQVPLGIYCATPQIAQQRIKQGFMFVNVASDLGAMIGGVRKNLENVQ
jgi:4-hydroxy-2-oxoheptanedioate aldolase